MLNDLFERVTILENCQQTTSAEEGLSAVKQILNDLYTYATSAVSPVPAEFASLCSRLETLQKGFIEKTPQ